MSSTRLRPRVPGIAEKALDAARDEHRWPLAAMAVASLVAAGLIFYLTRGLTFHADEWAFVVRRQGNDLDTLLRPHNEHPVLLPLLMFKGGFYLVGLADYWPYRGLVIALHVLCAALLFLIARRRVGDALAVLPAALLLFFGPASEVILWPFEISFIIPVAAALGIVLALERGDVKGDLVAGLLLLLAFTSGSHGVPIAGGTSVYIILGDDRWRRLLRVVVVPVGLYGLWLLEYVDREVDWNNLSLVPEFIADSAGANLAALVALDSSWGWVLALGLGVAVVVRLIRDFDDSRWLLALLTMVLVSWVLTALFRPWTLPPPGRYLYVSGVFLLLIVIEVVRGIRLQGSALALAYAIAAVVVAFNIGDLQTGADRLRKYSDFVSPGLAALELAKGRVDPAFKPEPLLAGDVVAGKYFSAVARFESPATPPEQIAKLGEEVRRATDAVLLQALHLNLEPASLPRGPGRPPAVGWAERGGVRTRGACVRFIPIRQTGSLELRVAVPGVALRAAPGASAKIRLRRFATGYGRDDVAPGQAAFPELMNLSIAFGVGMHRPVVLGAPDGQVRALRIPPDRASHPWHLRIAAKQPVLVCQLPRSAA